MSITYTSQEIQEAKQLIEDLESFSNKDLGHIANRRVADKNRRLVITELLIKEFGVPILNKNIYKVFGEDTITQSTSYRRPKSKVKAIENIATRINNFFSSTN